jgi:hypothetical protein
LKEMFKPAWQRAGGAAGALVNPARNMVSSALTSWQQAEDMKGHRIARTLRAMGAAARGAVTGTYDALQGVANGDDWAKMRERMKKRDAGDFSRAYRANYYRSLTDEERVEARAQALGARLQSFIGQTPVNSEGYKTAATTLKTFRDEAFVGRAIGEMSKDARKLSNIQVRGLGASGQRLQVTADGVERDVQNMFDYVDASGKKYTVSYEAVHDVFERFKAGHALSDKDYRDLGLDVGDTGGLRALHENIEKKAAVEYVNVAVAARKRLDTDPTLTKEQRETLEGLADREVLDRIARYREAIGAMNIPADKKRELFAELERNPGKFLAGANKKVQDFLTIATQMGKMEQMQSEGKKN